MKDFQFFIHKSCQYLHTSCHHFWWWKIFNFSFTNRVSIFTHRVIIFDLKDFHLGIPKSCHWLHTSCHPFFFFRHFHIITIDSHPFIALPGWSCLIFRYLHDFSSPRLSFSRSLFVLLSKNSHTSLYVSSFSCHLDLVSCIVQLLSIHLGGTDIPSYVSCSVLVLGNTGTLDGLRTL